MGRIDSLDLPRGEDSNDSNLDSISENVDSVDSLGPSDTASERVASSIDRADSNTPQDRIESQSETEHEQDDKLKSDKKIVSDLEEENEDAKVSSDIDDDEAMSIDDDYVNDQGDVESINNNDDNSRLSFDPQHVELYEPHSFSPKDLLSILRSIETDIHCTENKMRDEVEKRRKYRVDDCRRVHNYDEFITSFLAMLTERNMLADLVEHSLGKAGNHGKKETDKDSKSKTNEKDSKSKASDKDSKTKLTDKEPKLKKDKISTKSNLKHLKTRPKKKRIISESDWSDTCDTPTLPPAPPPIMYKDPTLPPGWKRKVKKRTLGPQVGKWDVFIVNPDGRKFKTRSELRSYLDRQSDSDLDIDNFDFTVSGPPKRGNIKFNTKKKK